MYKPLTSWPEVSRDPLDIQKLYGSPVIGLDLEWDRNGKPSVTGLSNGKLTVSTHWTPALPYLKELLTRFPNTVLVGHNVVGADMFVLNDQGIKLDLNNMEDTIISHWLVNMHLCKATGKAALEEDEDEKRGRGFMNLWTMLSLTTDLPHYKDCRDSQCEGPCPVHDVFGYNGLDALGPVLALPQLQRTMALRGLGNLYQMHKKLAWRLAHMRDFGILVDTPYVDTLREEFEHAKAEIEADLPFNPKSQQQVIDYFAKQHNIFLDDNTEATIRAKVEDLGEDAPDELLDLQDYKELGNGPDRWFQPYYIDKNGDRRGFVDERGFAHPHLGFFTSSARLMCSSPNFQNVAKRRKSRKKCECGNLKVAHVVCRNDKGEETLCIPGVCKSFTGLSIGKQIRRAIIAPPGFYIVRADYSNAENRNFLYLAGYEPPKGDLHNWMVENIGLKETDEFAIASGGARDASKSVTHAADYMEGLKLVEPHLLKTGKYRKEINEGARLVFPEWTFRGKVVTFTGINLARRAFGAATIENRRRALEITSRYIDRTFPKLRALQQRITKQVEAEGVVRPPHGYVLLSYGDDEDRLKTAAAVWGSQPVAHFTKEALLRLWDRFDRDGNQRPVLQVHDEIITYTRSDIEPGEAVKLLRGDMEVESPEMPGFVIPAEGSHGPNWRDQTKVK